ncbi:ATP-binding protein [Galbitalea soli]|uniref:ATP-binding protein n=1 Tax=Galbitalea soli TaxID=1268042 RepID=A0A7C9TR63_9MICO|nr:ATP-binding protein [Galbitalea soli]NEM91956.1 ATP-binding protein [Galbitalea soli]NYJ32096.1 serine/threonine-protein kinase RsbW [Galbitalea soli]
MADGHRVFELTAPPDDVDTVHRMLGLAWPDGVEVGALDRMAFETALVELAANIIHHGDTGSGVRCTLEFAITSTALRATLRDSGPEVHVDWDAVTMPGEEAESGRGLALIRALVGQAEYERVGGTNVWTIIRPVSS